MKNEDLTHLKIDVQTTNDRNYLELAILFDKPKFVEYLPKIRKKYGIGHLVKLEEYDQLMDDYFKSTESKFDFSTYENVKELTEYANKNVVWYEEIEDADMNRHQQLDTDAAILCYIFHRPPYFSEPIKQAILCGMVNGDLFDTTSTTIIEQDMLYSTTGHFQLPQLAILISPTSTDIEIKEQIWKARDMFKSDPKLSYYIPRVDQVNQIRLYRDWYWKSLADVKNKEILDGWSSNPNREPNSDMDESRISKGIAHYKKLLTI